MVPDTRNSDRPLNFRKLSRRVYLISVGTTGGAAIAGCTAIESQPDTEEEEDDSESEESNGSDQPATSDEDEDGVTDDSEEDDHAEDDTNDAPGDGEDEEATEDEDLVFSEGLTSTQFGTAVHRLCELSLTGSTIDWTITPGQIVEDPDGLSPMVIEDLRNQVQYGVSDVQQLETGLPVRSTYDEYQVRLELPTGQVVGDIDHLTVTDDCYYVSDYKTDSLRNRDIEAVAEHYFTQLRVYACALSQADSTRDCVLRLIFTNAETTMEETLSLGDIDQWRHQFAQALKQKSIDN